MRISRLMIVATLFGGLAWAGLAQAKGRKGDDGGGGKVMTAEEAIADAEAALDQGRVGDAVEHAEKLQRTRGLSKELLRHVDLIVARCGLVEGKYDASEKILGRLHKQTPDDARLTEWWARALDGAGKGEQALPLFAELAAKDQLVDGDSYWALAQLERQKGDAQRALAHAELALQKPIVLQSDELDHAIHQFIGELSASKKK